MTFVGKIKIYSPSRRYGYISLEGYEDVLFHLKDLPWAAVEPRVDETLEFKVVHQHGKLMAGQIQRPDVVADTALIPRLKDYVYRAQLNFLFQPQAKQRQIILLLALAVTIIFALSIYVSQHFYQQHQHHKAQAFMQAQQKQVSEQRAALGELPDQVLSDQARRNISGQVYGTTKERSDNVSHSIDKLNGRLPVEMGKFKCDGRRYCSEMRSYAEALYFQKHCRGTKMDGNGNGIPCENDTRWLKR